MRLKLPVFSDRVIFAGLTAIHVFEHLYRREWRKAWTEIRSEWEWR